MTIESQLSKQLINRGLKVKSNCAMSLDWAKNRFAAKSMNSVSCPGVVNSGDMSQRDWGILKRGLYRPAMLNLILFTLRLDMVKKYEFLFLLKLCKTIELIRKQITS